MIGFRAMGTEVRVSTPDAPREAELLMAGAVQRVFADSEQRFSRFLPASELSRLNRAEGPSHVSEALFAALLRAKRYHELTGGVFDPTIGAALAASGYDRSFEPGLLDRDDPAPSVEPSRFDQVELDEAHGTVFRPPHVQLDFGGFVKGHTVDLAAALLPEAGAVEAGGDCMARGRSAWPVEVEDPWDPERTLLVLLVRDRAVATSAPNRRRWKRAGTELHHLIDPRTLAPTASDLAQATVLADSAELADVLAKAALVLGQRQGADLLSSFDGIAAVLIGTDRTVTRVGSLEVLDD